MDKAISMCFDNGWLRRDSVSKRGRDASVVAADMGRACADQLEAFLLNPSRHRFNRLLEELSRYRGFQARDTIPVEFESLPACCARKVKA